MKLIKKKQLKNNDDDNDDDYYYYDLVDADVDDNVDDKS